LILEVANNFAQRLTNARRSRIADMTPPAKRDGDGGIKPAMCRRPRAVLRPMLALFVGGCKLERYHNEMSFCGGGLRLSLLYFCFCSPPLMSFVFSAGVEDERRRHFCKKSWESLNNFSKASISLFGLQIHDS
jgi:hypothetical protein